MAYLNVETKNGDSALQTYGHEFSDVDQARDYLERHGGGTIAIVPDGWDLYDVSGWQRDFDYDCDREVLIVVEDPEQVEVDKKIEAELENILTASEVDEQYGLADGTARQYCNRGDLRGRKSGGTWLVHRLDADKAFGFDDDDDVEVYENSDGWVANTPIQATPCVSRHEAYKIARAYRRSSKEYFELINAKDAK